MERFERVVHRELIARGKTVAFAESCTGGAMAARLTAIPDASRCFLGSIVAYSNEWKERFLGVEKRVLVEKGAVSREVVEQMVAGLLKKTGADYGVAVSGIAGPSGGTAEKPIGTVYIGVGKKGGAIEVSKMHMTGDRASVIYQTVDTAFSLLWRHMGV